MPLCWDRLAGQLGYSTTEGEAAARLSLLSKSLDDAVFVAEIASVGVGGFVHVQIRHGVEHGPRAEVGSLVVDEDIHSRGVGSRLLSAAETWALERGIMSIVLLSNVIRKRAHAFYERRGYLHAKSQKFFVKSLGETRGS